MRNYFIPNENPNAACTLDSKIHLILDDKLDAVQNTLEKELKKLTIADVIKYTNKYTKG